MRASRTLIPEHEAQPWMRLGSLLIGFAAVTLLITAVGAHLYSDSLSSALLTIVLISLAIATALHARFLLLARHRHRETVHALDAAERQYKSVFDSTLDGVLILDDQAVCSNANPAALALLGTDRDGLLARSIATFFADADFKATWKRFLERTNEHGEARVSRGDGQERFIEFTAKANFLPGRHVMVLRDVTERKQTEAALRESEQRFEQIADNIQELFWMLDAEDMSNLYVNPAYQTITGRSCQSLRENPKSYEDLIHPEDRMRVLSRLKESVKTGTFDEEFRIVRPDNKVHWVCARGFPVRDSSGITRRIVGTAQDVTARKLADEQIARNLHIAAAARAEAEAFRATSLALTRNLQLDDVLDTLLQSLLRLVPCQSAQVILIEAGTQLFLAREVQNCESSKPLPPSPVTLDARDSPLLMESLATRKSLLIFDTAQERAWTAFDGFSHLRSWLCVPLIASQRVLGFLSLGDMRNQTFTEEHLRLAESLAIPAAVAIQNARLYEQAKIFRAELEQRLADLERVDEALGKVQNQQPC